MRWRRWQAAERAGADVVVLCDTNGGSIAGRGRRDHAAGAGADRRRGSASTRTTTSASASPTRWRRSKPAPRTSRARSTAYGERTGNCNLTSVIPNLAFKLKKPSVPDESLVKLKEMSQFVDEIANMRPNPRQPWVGAAAFSHKGGTHVNAVQKLVRSYEHIDPALVGNSRHVLMSELAGRSNIMMKARELGFDVSKDTPELNAMLKRVKELEHQGYEFEAAEGSLALLIRRDAHARGAAVHGRCVSRVDAIGRQELGVRGDRQSARRRQSGAHRCRGRRSGERPRRRAARRRSSSSIRDLEDVRLTDYKVRIVDSSSGTAARTRVLIESSDGTSTWTTIGVNENIIEASLQALVDSLEYGLLRKDLAARVAAT